MLACSCYTGTERQRQEIASGRLLLGFFVGLGAGILAATVGWLIADRFAGSCSPDHLSNYGGLYLDTYLAVDLLSLIAAGVLGFLFLRNERGLGRHHPIGRSLGLLALIALALYEIWYMFLASLTVHPVCW